MLFNNDKGTALEDRPESATTLGMGFQGIHPGEAFNTGPNVHQSADTLYLIVQREGEGAPKTHRCDNEQEVRIFLEALLAQGVEQGAMELYQATKMSFNVSFKPMVDLVSS